MIPGQPQPTLRPPGARATPPRQSANAHKRRVLFWGLASVLLILALIVLIVLPTKIGQREQPQVISPGTSTEQATPLQAPDISGVAQHDAGLALQAFLRLRAQADLQRAEIWAPGAWSASISSADLGDEHYGHSRFKEAVLAYESAVQQLLQLQSDRPNILLDTLASAQMALQANDVAPAIDAFERVIAMQANHPLAQAGLAQARVREQVLGLMKDGQRAQEAGELALAAKAYEAVLQLDASYLSAQAELTKVSESLAHQAYQKSMSQALSALDSGDLNAAEKALKQTANIKPGAAELQDARQRLQNAKQQSVLGSLRRQAQGYVAKEHWAEAAERYQKALDIDTQVTFARSGLAHALSRQKLNTQLDHYLEAPERLSSDEPLDNARVLLETNPGTAKNEPLLAAKLSALREAVRIADTPITLLIESDNQTQITIYHVGRLGAFERKEIKLRPGRYTVTGSREGYRDVREIISLSPATPAQISLRCEERI
jgi:tetratricopeptide (TPR) repeat protein